MKTARRRLGDEAEEIVVRRLVARGWRIVDRNWRGRGGAARLGEIDIVADDGEAIVVVEVRAVRDEDRDPLETVDGAKRRRLVRLAKLYAAARGLVDRPLRIDCVGVAFPAGGGEPIIEHIENAVAEG